MKLTIHLHLLPRLRKYRALPPQRFTPSSFRVYLTVLYQPIRSYNISREIERRLLIVDLCGKLLRPLKVPDQNFDGASPQKIACKASYLSTNIIQMIPSTHVDYIFLCVCDGAHICIIHYIRLSVTHSIDIDIRFYGHLLNRKLFHACERTEAFHLLQSNFQHSEQFRPSVQQPNK